MLPESLDTLQAKHQALLERLQPYTPRYTSQHRLQTRPTHEGAAHVELVDGHYDYVVTERGCELHRRSARDADEVLYWLLSDVTAGIAQASEARDRKAGTDSRRAWMAFQLDLLHALDPAWAARQRSTYEEVLTEYPFNDDGPRSIRPLHPVPALSPSGPAGPSSHASQGPPAGSPRASREAPRAWMDIPRLVGRLLWRHWPALLACFFAQRVAYDVLLLGAIQLAETGVLLSYAAIAVLIVSQLVGVIAMFLVLRPSMPVMQAATGLPAMLVQRSWLDVLAVALLPFFAYYAAWGLLDGIKRDFILTYQSWVSFDRREPLQDILALRGLWIALAVSWGLREVSKRRFAATRHGAWSLVVAACEAYWLFVGAAVITRGWSQATAWWESRVVVVALATWWENPFVGMLSLAPLKRVLDPGWDVVSTAAGAIAMPLVWLAIAAIVYGMDLRRRGRLDRHDARARLVGRRYRKLHPVLKKAVDTASGGWNGKGIPIVNAIRLVLRAGLPALLVLCVGWALLDVVDAQAWGLATQAIGPRPWDEWRVIGQPLSLLFNGPMSLQPALFTQLLRIVLLAATFDRAIAGLRAARG